MRHHLFAACVAAILGLHGLSPAQADSAGSQAWFATLDSSERAHVQSALQWTGDYKGSIDSAFGASTYAAIQQFQERAGDAPTGVLMADDLAVLYAESRRIKAVVEYHIKRRGTRVVYKTRTIYRPAVHKHPPVRKVEEKRSVRPAQWVLILP